MTIAHIKSNALRRTLIVILLPFVPFIFTIIAFVKAAEAFFEELKYQCGQGSGGLWPAVKDCWVGVDVARRHRHYVSEMMRDTQVRKEDSENA